MQIKTTVEHTLTFNVEYFEQTEGGMDNAKFGKTVTTLEEAIELRRLAKANESIRDRNWIITVDVQTKVNGKIT